MIRYQDIRPKLKTGDVIAFSGTGFISNMIKIFTRSDISHVGMVYAREEDGRVLIIESTTLNTTPDAKTGEMFKGVQIQYLSDRLRDCDVEVYHKPLIPELKFPDDMISWLTQIHEDQIPYDSTQAVLSGLDRLPIFNTDEDLSSLFCSELVVKALKIGGVLPKSLNPSEQHPEDVMELIVLGERSPRIVL